MRTWGGENLTADGFYRDHEEARAAMAKAHHKTGYATTTKYVDREIVDAVRRDSYEAAFSDHIVSNPYVESPFQAEEPELRSLWDAANTLGREHCEALVQHFPKLADRDVMTADYFAEIPRYPLEREIQPGDTGVFRIGGARGGQVLYCCEVTSVRMNATLDGDSRLVSVRTLDPQPAFKATYSAAGVLVDAPYCVQQALRKGSPARSAQEMEEAERETPRARMRMR